MSDAATALKTPLEIASARQRSIADYAGKRLTWDKRKTRPSAGDYWACCPFHQEKTSSFHVLDQKGIFKCFGCDEKGDIFALVMRWERCDFPAAVDHLNDGHAVNWPQTEDADKRRKREQRAIQRQEFIDGCAAAASTWSDCETPGLGGGVVRPYLGSKCRGISAATIALVARNGGALRERINQYGQHEMVAAAHHNVKGGLCALQHTPLRRDGAGRVGNRYTTGKSKDAAVRCLAPANGELAIAEGLETALAFYDLHHIPCWATLGTTNLKAFRPPAGIQTLIVAADGDDAGLSAADELFERLRRTLRVVISPAPRGSDWADVLASKQRGAHVIG